VVCMERVVIVIHDLSLECTIKNSCMLRCGFLVKLGFVGFVFFLVLWLLLFSFEFY